MDYNDMPDYSPYSNIAFYTYSKDSDICIVSRCNNKNQGVWQSHPRF